MSDTSEKVGTRASCEYRCEECADGVLLSDDDKERLKLKDRIRELEAGGMLSEVCFCACCCLHASLEERSLQARRDCTCKARFNSWHNLLLLVRDVAALGRHIP
jgi:hypothetical protein